MSAQRKRQLTPRQQLFVKYLILTGNASHAARLAGVSESQAHNRGSKWRSKPHIQDRLFAIKQTAIRKQANTIIRYLSADLRKYMIDGHLTPAAKRGLKLLARLEALGDRAGTVGPQPVVGKHCRTCTCHASDRQQ